MSFQSFYFIHGCKLIVPLLGCIKHIIIFSEIKSMPHNRCKDSTFKRFRNKYFFGHFIDIPLTYVLNKFNFYIIRILYSCHWSIITTLNENCSRKFNPFWIPVSLAIGNSRQTLQFVINLTFFIKFQLTSHFGLYFKRN